MKPVLILAVVAISGCGGVSVSVTTEPDASYDSTKAKETLLGALDAWKQGKAATLARQKPPIRFSDDDLLSGYKLVDYKLARPDEPIQRARSIAVVLQLARGKGPAIERQALYQVSLAPQLAVMRADP